MSFREIGQAASETVLAHPELAFVGLLAAIFAAVGGLWLLIPKKYTRNLPDF